MILLKNSSQIGYINESCGLILKILNYIDTLQLVGMTTLQIDSIIEEWIDDTDGAESGIGYRRFPANSCISINDELVHGIPSDRIINDGDLVSVDLFLKLNGWWGDSAITMLACDCGDVNKHSEQTALINSSEKAFYETLSVLNTNHRLQDVVNNLNFSIRESGYFTNERYTGHGIGMKLHEPPVIPCTSRAPENIKLVPGLILAIEPMSQIDSGETYVDKDGWTVRTKNGTNCSHFERCVAITEDEPIILGGNIKYE